MSRCPSPLSVALVLLLTLGGMARAAEVADLAPWLGQPELWSTTPADLPRMPWLKGFTWLTGEQEDAHYTAHRKDQPLQFAGVTVQEANLRFAEGRLASVYLSLYNRGDLGPLPEERFDQLVTTADRAITGWVGAKGGDTRRELIAGQARQRRGWVRGQTTILLTWSHTGNSRRDFQAEYVQVDVVPYRKDRDPRRNPSTTATRPAKEDPNDLVARLDRAEGWVRIVDIPMVDQGPKGYCAAATTERVLRYYGMDVSQHVIAQLAGTSAQKGTDHEQMLAMIKRAGVKFKVRVREHYVGIATVDDLFKMVKDYNRVAKRAGKPRVEVPEAQVIDLAEIYAQLDTETYRRYRLDEEQTAMRRFLAEVRDHIDKGVPLVWGVQLGLVQEERLSPQSRGGHLRLITGYHEQEKTLAYSDSWGPGHERKTMSWDDAWTITTGLYSFDPRR